MAPAPCGVVFFLGVDGAEAQPATSRPAVRPYAGWVAVGEDGSVSPDAGPKVLELYSHEPYHKSWGPKSGVTPPPKMFGKRDNLLSCRYLPLQVGC